MIRLNLRDPAIRALIIDSLLDQADNDKGSLLSQGVGQEWIDTIRSIPSRHAIRASHLQHVTIEIAVNEKQLLHAFGQAADERRVRQLRDYFIEHGASVPMICKMFKMSSKEAKAARQLFIAKQRLGRPPMPATLFRDAIHSQWDAITKTQPTISLREQIYLLHQHFPTHTLATLWSVVHEFDAYEVATLTNQHQGLSSSSTKWVGGSCVHKIDTSSKSPTSSLT
jgi:hypothetical protein